MDKPTKKTTSFNPAQRPGSPSLQTAGNLSPLTPRATRPETSGEFKNLFSEFSISSSVISSPEEISEISTSSIHIEENPFKSALKSCATAQLRIAISFIKNHINSAFNVEYNENMSTMELLELGSELNMFIANQKPDTLLSQFEKSLQETLDSIFLIIREQYGNEIQHNLEFSFMIYRVVFLTNSHREIKLKTKRASEINLNTSQKLTIIPNIDNLINSTINELKEIIRKKCYSVFCPLVDDKKNLHEKAQIFLPYIGEEEIDTSFVVKGMQMMFSISSTKQNVASLTSYTTNLHILLDLLIRIQQNPKTDANLKIIVAECDNFITELQNLIQIQQEHLPSQSSLKTPFIQDCHSIINHFILIKNSFSKLLISNDWLPDSTKKFLEPQKQRKQKPGKHNRNNSQKPSPQSTSTTPEIKIHNIQAPLTQNSSVETNHLQSPTITPATTLETTTQPNPEEEIIQQEKNELFESIRQLFEKDRKEKLRLKKQKLGINLIEEDKKSEEPTPTEKPIPFISIQVGDIDLTFQKLEHSSFINPVWGVISNDNSIELQTLARYKQLLSNGTIGSGSISQLKSFTDCYEIGSSTMDSRLIGKKYNAGPSSALQNFIDLANADLFAKELAKYGVDNNISLIIFSAEAKKHQDINKVAAKL